MSNVKRYRVESDWDSFSITVDIDHDVMTDAGLHEINNFWSGAGGRLDESNGDIVHCVLRMLWAVVMNESASVFDVQGQFSWKDKKGVEGWPPMDGSEGITLVDYDAYDFFEISLTVNEVQRPVATDTATQPASAS